MEAERFQVDSMASYARHHANASCMALDVGMNEGFYTQMLAAMGCRVYSFELQPLCIKIAQHSLELNSFDGYVRIIHRPVSSAHNQKLVIHYPDYPLCIGTFSATAVDAGSKAWPHNHILNVAHTFHTVTLDSWLAETLDETASAFVNVLKIDVEGHEAAVLDGAKQLITSRRVGRVHMEFLNATAWLGSLQTLKRFFYSGYAAEVIGPSARGPRVALLRNKKRTCGRYAPHEWKQFEHVMHTQPWKFGRCTDVQFTLQP